MIRILSLVKNEADRFLPELLPIWRSLGEVWVQIDADCEQKDETIALLEANDCRWTHYEGTMEGEEWLARKHLFDWGTPGADWIVHLDADHLPAGDFTPILDATPARTARFYLYDMWSDSEYREDGVYWMVRPWWRAIRIGKLPKRDWTWSRRGWHSGHLPLDIAGYATPEVVVPRDLGILHLGYATPEARTEHHAAYMKRQRVLTDRELFHAQTIIKPARKVPLPFEPKWSVKPILESFSSTTATSR